MKTQIPSGKTMADEKKKEDKKKKKTSKKTTEDKDKAEEGEVVE